MWGVNGLKKHLKSKEFIREFSKNNLKHLIFEKLIKKFIFW
jgi:hypothetical protein